MKFGFSVLGVFVVIAFASSAYAGDARTDFNTQLNRVVTRLNREAHEDVEGSVRMSALIRREYQTDEAQLKWAVQHEVTWGDITVLAYLNHATGRSFERMVVVDDARRDYWKYADDAEMTPLKMAHSLESFLQTAENERNSRIFERLRVSRRIQALPDLGSGFGLFQDALDFRRLDPPRPTKVHVVTSGLAKGEQ